MQGQENIITNLHLVCNIPPFPDLLVPCHLLHIRLVVSPNILECCKQNPRLVIIKYRICGCPLGETELFLPAKK